MKNKIDESVKSFEKIKTLFEKPPVTYSSAPLWVWNDDVNEKLIDEQLEDMKFGGIHGVFIHPRPGLITPYLSDRWFDLCRYTVDKAKELDMEVWLYDENSYPSGFAGGHVPAEMPESYNQGQGLRMEQAERLPENAGEKYFLILKKSEQGFTDITANWQNDKDKEASYFLFEKTYEEKSPWYGGYSYVDLLLPGVTQKFIDVTMTTGYEKSIGNEFGKTVPGIFTDEPNIKAPGGTRWTPTLFTDFEKRWGYDLKTNLPALFIETGDWQRIRHNYYNLLLELFIDRWSKPWHQYCAEHDLNWTGHYWEHGWPDPGHGGDNMAMYAWHQMPAIDILMNQYSESVNAQFGNVRSVKELRSAANQMGRSRTLSETYGAGGWDLRFEDMKRIGDWEYVLGVNFLNQHLSYITLAGARKRDHPQSFSYHDPWWKFYHVQGEYFSRLSLAMSSGEQINKILVLEPTTTAWMYFSPQESDDKYDPLGPTFQKLVFELEKMQIEYDLGSENIIKDQGKIAGDQFFVGKRSYRLIILPPGLENLNQDTADLLIKYMENGGQVISLGGIPAYIDGQKSQALESLVEKYQPQWHRANSLTDQAISPLLKSDQITFHQPEQVKGILFHHRRRLEDGQLLFLVNTDLEEWSTGSFSVVGHSVQELDLISGKVAPYPWQETDNQVTVNFDLPPAGSLLLFISPQAAQKPDENSGAEIGVLEPIGEMMIERKAPNALTLDYVNLTVDEKSENDLYFFAASDKVFKAYGFEGDPWSRSVQFKSEILDRNTFPPNSGFTVTYAFSIQDGVDKGSLQAVIERPANWQVSINGTGIEPNKGKYWLDRAFAVYNIGSLVTTGKNVIRLDASPMTVHSEIEPIYLTGDFNLASADKGWTIVTASPVRMGSWAAQGMPFYSDGVRYSQKFNLDQSNKRYVVKLTNWLGCVAEVRVNDKSAGIIAWQPSECDVTDLVRKGENEISVIVYGTLKNLLGPHHNGPIRGSAWPASFESAPPHLPSGVNYDVIDYGLFEPFLLIESKGAKKRVYYRDYQVAKPEIRTSGDFSVDTPLKVILKTRTPGAEIYYTLNGAVPDKNDRHYQGPILLTKNSLLKTRAFKKDLKESAVAQKSFYILDSKVNGLNYAYFDGQWDDLPAFKDLKPTRRGRTYDFDLNHLKTRSEKFAVKFNGYITLAKAGIYNFYVNSNDGSELFIGDRKIVDNSGSHGPQERQGAIKLQAGTHPISVLYFDSGGSQLLEVAYQAPGMEKRPIPADILRYKP